MLSAVLPNDGYADQPDSTLRAIPAATQSDDSLRAFAGGSPSPFVLSDVTGARQSLGDYAGRPLLVHFFATWCEPCVPEMQALERLAARHGHETPRIVAISVAEPNGRVQRFFEKFPVSFPVLLDADRATAKSWKVETLPTTFLLDADLKPRFFIEQPLAWDQLDLSGLLHRLNRPARAGQIIPYPHQQTN